jgi:hypothetical protein
MEVTTPLTPSNVLPFQAYPGGEPVLEDPPTVVYPKVNPAACLTG